MKKIIYLLFFLCIFSFIKSQSYPFPVTCAFDAKKQSNIEKLNSTSDCGNTSPFYSNNSLYLPQLSDNVIYTCCAFSTN